MAEQRAQRRLAAILAADVVGYSRLVGADEEGTVAALKHLQQTVIDPTIAAHRGRIVKRTGDGVLVEFVSAVEAVRCAIEMQQAVARSNEDRAEDRKIEFRIGVNVGDIIVETDDIFGDGVNIAARLEGISEPGGVCLSHAAYEQIKGKIDLAIEDGGEQRLKNISQPIHVYRLRPVAAGQYSSAQPLSDRPSIAVLPFQNISGDPEQDYFADGMVEDIITGLSRFRSFFVIARNSTFIYKGRAVDVRQVGRELGVRYVLEGSVRKGGNRLRVTAQLVDAGTGNHLWAEKYDGAVDDVFDLQDKITAGVVGIIEPNVRLAEIERARRKRPDNLDAYDLYLRALPLAFANVPEDGSKALELLDEALRLDPSYGVAHGIAAWCCIQVYGRATSDPKYREAAIRHARAALTSGTDDATALAFAGFVLGILERDKHLALGAAERALALNPNSAIAYARSAYVNAFAGRLDIAIEHATQAIRLSPLDTMRYSAETARALAYFHKGRYAEAAEGTRHVIRENPRYDIGYAMLAASCVKLGQTDEAREAIRRLHDANPLFTLGGLASFSMGTDAQMGVLLAALREAGLPE
jgi:TolB-like protein/Tfp pilus assembly protein PilF